MTPIEELDLLLTIIRKYDLPLSPILEYAVTEKKEENAVNAPVEEIGKDEFEDGADPVVETEPASISIVDFDIPENADTTTRNKYLMQFCYGILSEFKDALDERERNVCDMLLVENNKRKTSEKYRITEERVRQIFVKSIKKISQAHNAAMLELEGLRKENEELKRRNYLLEGEIKNSSSLENVVSLQELENSLCYKATRLLASQIVDLPFSNRTQNILRVARVEYFKEIPQLKLEEVQKFRNCGRKTITELRDFMYRYSLDFGMTYEDVVSQLTKYGNDDFPPSLFTNQDAHKWAEKNRVSEESTPKDSIAEGVNDEEGAKDSEVEHVFLNPSGKVEGTFTLSANPGNRSGMPWTFEEEQLIRDFYYQGRPFSEIAKTIGRTEVAVMSRLGMLGVIDYTYGQEYKPDEEDTPNTTDDIEEEPEDEPPAIDDSEEESEDEPEYTEFDGKKLVDRYYYPVQDNVFWDEKNQVYEMYLADSYELVINHLIFNFDKLHEIEAEAEGLTEDEREELFSDYWYDNHINVIARIKPGSDGFELLQFETGSGIQEIDYKSGEYAYIKMTDEDDGLEKFIDYNGTVFDSPEQIMTTTNTDVARYHDFYDAPKHIIKEYIRLGMTEIKRIYKGGMKKVTIFTDSELGQAIKDNSVGIWMLDGNSIITKLLTDDDSVYPLKVYFRNGVKTGEGGLEAVKKESLVLQAQMLERAKRLRAGLKKKKDLIRFERQFREITSTLFAFAEDGSDDEDAEPDSQE